MASSFEQIMESLRSRRKGAFDEAESARNRSLHSTDQTIESLRGLGAHGAKRGAETRQRGFLTEQAGLDRGLKRETTAADAFSALQRAAMADSGATDRNKADIDARLQMNRDNIESAMALRKTPIGVDIDPEKAYQTWLNHKATLRDSFQAIWTKVAAGEEVTEDEVEMIFNQFQNQISQEDPEMQEYMTKLLAGEVGAWIKTQLESGGGDGPAGQGSEDGLGEMPWLGRLLTQGDVRDTPWNRFVFLTAKSIDKTITKFPGIRSEAIFGLPDTFEALLGTGQADIGGVLGSAGLRLDVPAAIADAAAKASGGGATGGFVPEDLDDPLREVTTEERVAAGIGATAAAQEAEEDSGLLDIPKPEITEQDHTPATENAAQVLLEDMQGIVALRYARELEGRGLVSDETWKKIVALLGGAQE